MKWFNIVKIPSTKYSNIQILWFHFFKYKGSDVFRIGFNSEIGWPNEETDCSLIFIGFLFWKWAFGFEIKSKL